MERKEEDATADPAADDADSDVEMGDGDSTATKALARHTDTNEYEGEEEEREEVGDATQPDDMEGTCWWVVAVEREIEEYHKASSRLYFSFIVNTFYTTTFAQFQICKKSHYTFCLSLNWVISGAVLTEDAPEEGEEAMQEGEDDDDNHDAQQEAQDIEAVKVGQYILVTNKTCKYSYFNMHLC